MKLFYVSAMGDNNDILDLFIEASDAAEAGQMLIDYWTRSEIEIDDNTGVHVHEVPQPTGVKGVLDWSRINCWCPGVTYPDTTTWWESDEAEE